MKNLIKIKNLSKKFGSLKAVRNISFNLNQGEILGFLGPNGAGKTTTMRMITGFLKPTEGEVLINGLKIDDHPESCKKFIGYVAEGSPLYVEMTTLDFLRFSISVLHFFCLAKLLPRLKSKFQGFYIELSQSPAFEADLRIIYFHFIIYY